MKFVLSKYQWYSGENIRVTGFIRMGNRYLEKKELAEHFLNAGTMTAFEKLLRSANGQFSVILKNAEGVFAAVDRLRNYPLFYANIDGQAMISDECYALADAMPEKHFDDTAVDSFLASGYVINELTLIRDVFQVEAGAFVVFGDKVTCRFYHDPLAEKIIDVDINTAAGELSELFHTTFKDHLEALKDRFIAIPLSGGFDSRLVASMVARYHPRNVLCYTYGRRDNYDVAPAKEVAERLGFKWVNIIYDSDRVKDFPNDGFFTRYYPYVSGLTGMFFMQEYFAVRFLKENQLVPDDCVFMSGFSGDMLAGSYLTPVMKKKLTRDKISDLILRDYFRLIPLEKIQKKRILEQIRRRIPEESNNTWKVIEMWDVKERHAKFIVNSAKVFKYFGYEYVFPLWDNLLVDYLLNMPFHLKMDRKLYEYTLREHIFNPHGLNLEHEVNPKAIRKSIQRVKERIKQFLPGMVINLFLDLKSPILYDEITAILLDGSAAGTIKKPLQPNYYNSYLTQWYLAKTRDELVKPPA